MKTAFLAVFFIYLNVALECTEYVNFLALNNQYPVDGFR